MDLAKSYLKKSGQLLDYLKGAARSGAEVTAGERVPISASLTRRQRILRIASLCLGVALLFFAGLFLMFHIFFKDVNFNEISRVKDSNAVEFRYDGVAYFHGHILKPGNTVEFPYYAPWVMALSGGVLEIYVDMPDAAAASQSDATQTGTLVVTQKYSEQESRLPVSEKKLQRLRVEWRPRASRRNKLSVKYVASDSEAEKTVNVAVRVTEFSLFWPAVFVLIAGAALLVFAVGMGRASPNARTSRVRLACLLALTGFAFFVHSGAFTSNDFFGPGHRKVTSTANQLGHLAREGTMSEINYRDPGILIVPALAGIVEGGSEKAIRGLIYSKYPVFRYVMFALFMGALLFLASMLSYLVGRSAAYLFVVLAVLYFPFIIDLYFPDSDAMFLLIFPAFLAFALRARYGLGPFWPSIVGMMALMFLMGLTKTTPAFLIVISPIIFLLPFIRPWRPQIAAAFFVMVCLGISFNVGKGVARAVEHPERHVGIKGEPFQKSVFWHIIWAAYGIYDNESAHAFTKSGPERQQRVSERTGLPYKRYLRQAETATREVYKPDVLNALRESPGFFYSTAFLRFYNHGLRFYRYTYGFQKWRAGWIKDRKVPRPGSAKSAEITWERKAIRFDEAWKFSPLVLLLKLTQAEITPQMDLFLLFLAFIGLLALRYTGLAVFLILCGLAQIAFGTLIHVPDRYVLFCSIAWLLGLSITLQRFVSLIIDRPAASTKAQRNRGKNG